MGTATLPAYPKNFGRPTGTLAQTGLEMLQHDRMASVLRFLAVSAFLGTIMVVPALNQTPSSAQHSERPLPPARDPHTPGYVEAKELPDGKIPPANVDGNFIIGPTHDPAAGMSAADGTPNGTVIEFTMNSSDSKIYPGIAREPNTFGTPDPADPAKLIVKTSHPAPYTRKVTVYVPKQYLAGSVAPFIVGADGPDQL